VKQKRIPVIHLLMSGEEMLNLEQSKQYEHQC